MPSRDDPFGEFDHLVPVPLAQAAKCLQICRTRVEQQRAVSNQAAKHAAEMAAKLETLIKDLEAAEYQLSISAVQAHLPTEDFVPVPPVPTTK